MPEAPVSPPDPPRPADGRYGFGPFTLDLGERRLLAGGAPVALQNRYFDLLACLVAHAGTLVRKDTLFEAVWPGVVVGDAALTQGIRAIRLALGDDAARPQFVETVPGHGYRFVAPVTSEAPTLASSGAVPVPGSPSAADTPPAPQPLEPTATPLGPMSTERASERGPALGGAVLGAGVSSLAGGVLYGATLGAGGPHPGSTTVSVIAMSIGAGLIGALAVAAGASFGRRRRGAWGALLGGALAGGLVGAVGEALGRSVLMTLTGRAVGDLTGGLEGLVVGAALALAFALPGRGTRAVVATAAACLVVFAGLAALGRPLFVGSLEQTLALPGVPLRLSGLAPGGPTAGLRVLLSSLEGLLFGLGFSFGARQDG